MALPLTRRTFLLGTGCILIAPVTAHAAKEADVPYVPTPIDHKRVGDGDTGPNTGGMGAYSPAPVLTPALEAEAIETIIKPTIAGMAKAGTPYSGVLYAGLMLTRSGPKLIEYNARFGDPECQVLMLRFEGDLLELMLATEAGELAGREAPRFGAETALTVVMAAKGYPGTPQTGGAIDGLDAAEETGAQVFQAGTKLDGGQLVAAGGRVLTVTATGATVSEAQAAAYRAVDAIDLFAGIRDIVGGRSGSYERPLKEARRTALEELKAEALALGANGVIGIDRWRFWARWNGICASTASRPPNSGGWRYAIRGWSAICAMGGNCAQGRWRGSRRFSPSRRRRRNHEPLARSGHTA